MYHVAICDDDKTFIAYIKKIINQSKGKNDYSFKMYEFYSGEELVNSLDQNVYFDLLILDMELGGIDGDEVARLYRAKYKDTVLVFCSGVRAPTVRSFKATPFRYILKSYSDKQIISEMEEVLQEVEKISNRNKKYIVGHYRNNVIRVDLQNVLYVENAKRGSKIIVCRDCEEAKFVGQILVDDKLDMLSIRFPELVYAHSSYIININHVEKIVNNEIYLDNGERLSVSRPYQKMFREIFARTIAAKY